MAAVWALTLIAFLCVLAEEMLWETEESMVKLMKSLRRNGIASHYAILVL